MRSLTLPLLPHDAATLMPMTRVYVCVCLSLMLTCSLICHSQSLFHAPLSLPLFLCDRHSGGRRCFSGCRLCVRRSHAGTHTFTHSHAGTHTLTLACMHEHVDCRMREMSSRFLLMCKGSQHISFSLLLPFILLLSIFPLPLLPLNRTEYGCT